MGSRLLLTLSLIASALLCGCGKATPQKTYRVGGDLLVKGQPAAGARLTLQPAAAPDLKLWPMGFPTAIVQPDGKFWFTCYSANDGAPEGEYKLLVTWVEGDEIPSDDQTAPAKPNRVDAKYAKPETTPLSVTVEKKTNQIPRIEIP